VREINKTINKFVNAKQKYKKKKFIIIRIVWDLYQQMNAIMVILGTSVSSYYKFGGTNIY
jgi:hypothetical protein